MTRQPRTPRRRTAKHPSGPAYQLKVTLLDVQPPVWRRILVPGNITLDRLHIVIQKAVGWTDSHLHEFIARGKRYGQPDPEEPEPDLGREWLMLLQEIAPAEGQRFEYLYDFGDSWMHEVLVERIETPEKAVRYPVCLGGERHCPPEDCGGPGGYEDFLKAIRDRSHPEHREMLEWIGGAFDPEAFDLKAVNQKLRLIK